MKDTEQQVEELEIFWNEDIDEVNREIVIQKAKLLKEKIEKGCGKGFNFKGHIIFCDGCSELNKFNLCPTCQNLIKRLNKIIGDEE